jgi:hypothetical protein
MIGITTAVTPATARAAFFRGLSLSARRIARQIRVINTATVRIVHTSRLKTEYGHEKLAFGRNWTIHGLIDNLTFSLDRVVAMSDLGPTGSPEPGVLSSRSWLVAKGLVAVRRQAEKEGGGA